MYMEYYNQPFQKLTYSDIKVHDWCKRGSCVSLSRTNIYFFDNFLLHGRVVKSYALIIIRGFILYTISRFSIRKCFPSSKPKVCQVDLFQLYTVVIIFTYRTISKQRSIFTHSYEMNVKVDICKLLSRYRTHIEKIFGIDWFTMLSDSHFPHTWHATQKIIVRLTP